MMKRNRYNDPTPPTSPSFSSANCNAQGSHSADNGQSNASRRPFGNGRNYAPEGKLVKWKQLLQNGGNSTARPSLQIVDVGAAQETIKLLATEVGLSFIKDLTPGCQLWERELRPLFQLEVAIILNYMVGVGGSRMNKLFHYIESLFQLWDLSLAVLAKMLDCNTTNIIRSDFSTFADSLSRPLEDSAEPEEMIFRFQATKHLRYIRQQVQSHGAVTQDMFVLARDFPGNLSAGGPRHDNDYADIANIKILPTYEEIMSPREEYLPVNDCSQWHIPGISGRLDREFRLIREDTVGQLRDAIRGALEHIRSSNNKASHRTNNNSLRTYTYDSAMLINIRFDKNTGLDFVVRCDQPPPVPALNPQQRKDWWERSKRLQVGALVCVVDGTESVMFCTVSESTLRNQTEQKTRTEKKPENTSAASKLTLSDDGNYLHVNLQLIDATRDDVAQALRWYKTKGPTRCRLLVEFPGILLASFKHTLDALKEMRQKPHMPFVDLLAPPDDKTTEPRIEPPQYARAAGFAFDLRCLTNDGAELFVSPHHLPDLEAIESRTSLDITQCSALLNTLSQELSLIQGPPGTGKSYTGQKIIEILLANKNRCTLGPILCVCYTNHALDQLLEHLLDAGISNIIRIGSRSKSERLQALNLRVVSQKGDRTKSEKTNLYNMGQELDVLAADIEDSLRALSTPNSANSLKKYLAKVFPVHHTMLFDVDEDGWETVDKPQTIIRRWLEGGSRDNDYRRDIEILQETELFALSNAERQELYQYWMKNSIASFVHTITQLQEKHAELIERRSRVRSDVDLRCLNQANIIGVTTTGLAKNLHLLRKLRSKVMLCEEAGEVLEAHILTALLPSIEHAILIGDHLQLRPQIQNYELQSTNPRGKQYSLDTSLFERLVEPPHLKDLRLPFSTLETQRRMHPSISELIRSTLYPSLRDGENVKSYPAIVGMKERLFWLHHDQLEAGAASHDPLNTSHSNDFEVEMTVSLLSHIVRQGEYTRDDIAVITPYLGQLHKLRRRMESMFEICLNDRDLAELEEFEDRDQMAPTAMKKQPAKSTLLKSVRMATVDNFQGEEAKVIIISLVRSNQQKKCGFLSTSNRINVLLSRAQHGMYIIGNSDTYRNVAMWEEVINMLSAKSLLGESLELQCSRHPDTPIQVSQPDHFVIFSPESGCNLSCDKRLHCGHSCTGRCHSDLLHNAVKCLEPCPRPQKGCSHPCPRACGDACPDKCYFQLDNIDLALPCGHKLSSAKCWENQNPASIRCRVLVRRTVPGCNHEVEVQCHVNVTSAKYRCTARCGHHRECGHTCNSLCYQCNTRDDGKVTEQIHGICEQICGRGYSMCRHGCSKPCHGDEKCPPCKQPCEACNEPCAPCAESTCHSSCPHTRCTMPCAAPCDWVPCSKRCEKVLRCGHQCPSLCGETCPNERFCQQCATEDIKSLCVDFLEMKEYHEIDLDQEPCIFPDCGHFLTTSSMDGQMEMAAHYEVDMDGHPIRIGKASEAFSLDDSGTPVCAICRGSLRNIARYGRIVRRAMLDESTKKFIEWSHGQYISLANHLLKEQEKLGQQQKTQAASSTAKEGKLMHYAPRLRQLRELERITDDGRYSSIINLWKRIGSFASDVRREEQPFQRVADFVLYANRQNTTRGEFRFDDSINQIKGSLLADTLLLKCDLAILFDFRHLAKGKALEVAGLKLDLSHHWSDSLRLVELSHKHVYSREEVQGHIFAVQLCVFCTSFEKMTTMWPAETQTTENLKEEALKHIQKARALMEEYPSAAIFDDEIDRLEIMVTDGVYHPVTAEEMRAVYKAMSQEIRGTGHWYTCENNHPFTIGECGMPMEQRKCPDCNAMIGGSNHEAVDGTRRATEIENLAQGMDGLGI
ncbi:hypothetical protein HDV63DRAFT_414622 [Trichoderma sp. SZMC 28014]